MTVEELFRDYWYIIYPALMLIGGAIWWAAGTQAKMRWNRSDIKDIKGDIKDIDGDIIEIKVDIVEIKNDITGMKNDITGMKNDITEIRGEITGIKTVLNDLLNLKELVAKALNLDLEEGISGHNSPSQLNELGLKISAAINGKKFVKKYLNAVIYNDRMSKYQLQRACFDYAQNELIKHVSDEELKELERVAFEQGTQVETILAVLGFDLRNAKFAELGMSITDDEKSLEPQE